MTRYQLEVTVPPGTAESDAVTETIEVQEPIITDGFRFGPPGVADTVFAVLRYGERQILPEPPSTERLIPDTTDPAPIDYRVPGTPYQLELRAWAPTSTFPHRVSVRFDAVEEGEQVQTIQFDEEATVSRTESRQPPVSAQELNDMGEDG